MYRFEFVVGPFWPSSFRFHSALAIVSIRLAVNAIFLGHESKVLNNVTSGSFFFRRSTEISMFDSSAPVSWCALVVALLVYRVLPSFADVFVLGRPGFPWFDTVVLGFT